MIDIWHELAARRYRLIVSRQFPTALDRCPHGFTGHVAHPIRSIVNRYWSRDDLIGGYLLSVIG